MRSHQWIYKCGLRVKKFLFVNPIKLVVQGYSKFVGMYATTGSIWNRAALHYTEYWKSDSKLLSLSVQLSVCLSCLYLSHLHTAVFEIFCWNIVHWRVVLLKMLRTISLFRPFPVLEDSVGHLTFSCGPW